MRTLQRTSSQMLINSPNDRASNLGGHFGIQWPCRTYPKICGGYRLPTCMRRPFYELHRYDPLPYPPCHYQSRDDNTWWYRGNMDFICGTFSSKKLMFCSWKCVSRVSCFSILYVSSPSQIKRSSPSRHNIKSSDSTSRPLSIASLFSQSSFPSSFNIYEYSSQAGKGILDYTSQSTSLSGVSSFSILPIQFLRSQCLEPLDYQRPLL